ncbi:MAG: DUF1800 domain-containing protein [Planctomycetota bacterium]|mgnify:CR=1 FL=1|nr:DUF1800 domain-containing protein [Planctomycetota bacterium]
MAIETNVNDLAAANDRSPTHDAPRRSFLTATASAAILAGFASRLRAQTSLPPPAPVPWTPDLELRFLVDRISNGWNPEIYARAVQLGYDAFLEEQLAPASIADPIVAPMMPQYPTVSLTTKQIYDQYVAPGNVATVMLEFRTATIVRAIYSKRQLFERMVEFWSDHFSVDLADGQVQWLKTAEDRDVIRANALGRFRDLLIGDAKSAAMLYYLDNYRNFSTAPNENYSREVMELHTLDVGNYTETDVSELARCITGWQFRNSSFANAGDFFFNAAQHDNGQKTVRGQVISPGGVTEGETVLTSLASDVATARFVTGKLCRFFLAYNPPQAVLDAVAIAYRVSGGDIKTVVRKMFERNTLHMMDPASIVKIKRPFHLVNSVVRALNPTVAQPNRFVQELTTMGHLPFAWSAPDGYPDTAQAWGTSVLDRWNFVSRFFSESITGVGVNVTKIFGPVQKNLLASHANRVLMGGRMAPEDVTAVQAYADAATTLNDTLRREVLALAASTPSFQTY